MREHLRDLPPEALVLAAVSGGADSLALLAALTWEAPRAGLRAGAVHVDHGLDPGSAAVATAVAACARSLGADPVEVLRVQVTPDGAGPEAAARVARHRAFDDVVARTGASLLLLGHHRDDQAEQVLLGLARGSGARSLAGMPARRGHLARPLLGLARTTLVDACTAQSLPVWSDPSNDDVALRRNRIRHDVLPLLEDALGGGVAEALARSADLLRADADLLDDQADAAYAHCAATTSDEHGLATEALAALPTALRTRVLLRFARELGAPGTDLSAAHVAALDALVTRWHGQGAVALPGGLAVVRRCDTLAAAPPAHTQPHR